MLTLYTTPSYLFVYGPSAMRIRKSKEARMLKRQRLRSNCPIKGIPLT